MFVSRKDYKWLIDNEHNWMKENWLSFKRMWNCYGVIVIGGSKKQMFELESRLVF